MSSSVGIIISNIWKNVPNHQPVILGTDCFGDLFPRAGFQMSRQLFAESTFVPSLFVFADAPATTQDTRGDFPLVVAEVEKRKDIKL